MDIERVLWLAAAGGAVAGVVFTLIVARLAGSRLLRRSRREAEAVVAAARKQADDILREARLEAKDAMIKMRASFEEETKERRQELLALERRLVQREENLDRKLELLERKEKEVIERGKKVYEQEKAVAARDAELAALLEEELRTLERISGMTSERAKALLMERVENEARHEAAALVARMEEEARRTAERNARQILSLAIQRVAADHVADTTVSVVPLPSDEMKGRIIGREGRNIRAFENVTGINVIIDDTPEAVILSGFDPIRREIARRALERLVADGRIHPARIEEVVAKVKDEVENAIQEEGERAAFEANVHNLHPEEIKLLGRLKYRTSYGQNVLQHSLEVAHLIGIMAAEIGADVNTAKRAGLLHDIGKAVDHEVEGPHALIGAELARKYGEPAQVVAAIAGHHGEEAAETLEAVLLQAADTISAARPGARRETLETYIKRLEKLETIADSFKGVSKAFAIQAGREIRVMVVPEQVDDEALPVLASEISRRIEQELEYPGQIKVTLVRETRAVDYAK